MSYEFPTDHAEVFRTPRGIPYLREPGVVLISKPAVDLSGLAEFFAGFDEELQFSDYLNDPTGLTSAEELCKFAGQLCYLSFGPKRSTNAKAEAYFNNIKSSGHGSVLEHANFTFLFYGISRSVTHELVRHRAGFGFSQVSQRYVSGEKLRFVLKPEYQQTQELIDIGELRLERSAQEYEEDVQRFLALQGEDAELMHGDMRTDRRKKVQQAAREFLPNAAEAPTVVTANVRGWRHFTEMRASEHSDVSIRGAAFKSYLILKQVAPLLFKDYDIVDVSDGTRAVNTPHRKV